MKKKSKIKKQKKDKKNKEHILRKDVKKHIAAVILLVFALIFALSLFGQAGIVGKFVNNILISLFGVGRYILPFLLLSLGVMYFKKMQSVRYTLATGGVILLFLAIIGLLHIFYNVDEMMVLAKNGEAGGYVGFGIAFALVKLIGKIAGAVSLFGFALIGFMLLFNVPVFNFFHKIKDLLKDIFESRDDEADEKDEINSLESDTESIGLGNERIINHQNKDAQEGLKKDRNDDEEKEKISFWKKLFSKKARKEAMINKADKNIKSWEVIENEKPTNEQFNNANVSNIAVDGHTFGSTKSEQNRKSNKKGYKNIKSKLKTKFLRKGGRGIVWKQPPLNLFAKSQKNNNNKNVEKDIKTIQQTLEDFGISVEPSGFNIGPTVTQYQFIPPAGVMLSKIVNLQSNLALALEAHAIRIEAPIPGTSLVGIEVPNRQPTMVRLSSLFDQEDFENASHLAIPLGEDVNGNKIIANLESMPHLLVAGSTNTGKSVCINSILSALIFKNSPDDLQLILVDPKRVELSSYSGIPYLLTDVITDMGKVVNVLKWATIEMDERYKRLAEVGSRNINSYNEKVSQGKIRKIINKETGETEEEPLEKMKYIVIVIDELSDLMATHGKEVEGLIVRLSQMARAVGIHLILSTQRPDTNVITGTIKNNIPARIAFKVGANVDSRTILDKPGAEKLLGNGDMLYLGPGYTQPIRIQGPFISEEETTKLIKFVKKQSKKIDFEEDESLKDSLEEKLSEMVVSGDVREGENSDDDILYEEAKAMVMQAGKASISAIQRRLRIGFNRAARIVDMLEENGVVGPADGSKPREVLIGGEQLVDQVSGPEDDMEVQEERERREF